MEIEMKFFALLILFLLACDSAVKNNTLLDYDTPKNLVNVADHQITITDVKQNNLDITGYIGDDMNWDYIDQTFNVNLVTKKDLNHKFVNFYIDLDKSLIIPQQVSSIKVTAQLSHRSLTYSYQSHIDRLMYIKLMYRVDDGSNISYRDYDERFVKAIREPIQFRWKVFMVSGISSRGVPQEENIAQFKIKIGIQGLYK